MSDVQKKKLIVKSTTIWIYVIPTKHPQNLQNHHLISSPSTGPAIFGLVQANYRQASNTFAARVKRSPDSPTLMFKTNFSTRIWRMGFLGKNQLENPTAKHPLRGPTWRIIPGLVSHEKAMKRPFGRGTTTLGIGGFTITMFANYLQVMGWSSKWGTFFFKGSLGKGEESRSWNMKYTLIYQSVLVSLSRHFFWNQKKRFWIVLKKGEDLVYTAWSFCWMLYKKTYTRKVNNHL